MLEPNIDDYSIQGPITPFPIETEPTVESVKQESGVSSIEKSKAVIVPTVPLFNFPILMSPQQDGELLGALTHVSENDRNSFVHLFTLTQQLEMGKIANDVLDGWIESLREIDRQVRELLNSPVYQAQQEAKLAIETGASVAGNVIQINPAVSMLEQLKTFSQVESERWNSTQGVTSASEKQTDGTEKLIDISIMSTVFVGGALALVSANMAAATEATAPLKGSFEIVNRLQPLIPQIAPQDLIPMINLFTLPLIYYTSWDAAIRGINHKGQQAYLEMADNFAKEVIKVTSDPAFVNVMIIDKMPRSEQLSPEMRDQLAAFIKLVLASLALSLLYTAEVGKMQQDKFLGMEPQEFRGLLTGEIPLPDAAKASERDRFKMTLIAIIHSQLAILPAKERARDLEGLFEYLADQHSVEDMLDPVKAFTEVLQANAFKPADVVGAETNPV